MPSARELLEQADALMRRNRGRDVDSDIPELTDEVAVASTEARLREPSPVTPRPHPPQHIRQADDVPELLDAVEELSLEPLPDDDGEISRWLEGDLGEASITGPAPDSIVVVPPSTVRSPLPTTHGEAPPIAARGDESGPAASTPPSIEISDDTPASVVASLEDESRPVFAPSVAAADAAMPAFEPPTASAALAATVSGALSGPAAEAPPASDPGFDAMLGAIAEVPPASDPGFDAMLGAIAEVPPVSDRASDAAPGDAAFEQEPIPPAADAAAAMLEPAHTEPEPIAAAVSTADAPKDRQWDGLAEEIRMQVLQRIDIFTDTGLHGELAARLQPIVDRASADLVTTINREVGQILRAYVAEAIEREIEKWREANP